MNKNKKALVGSDMTFTSKEWIKLMKSDSKNKLFEVSGKRLRESLIRGIPNKLRGQIWWFLWRAKTHKESFNPNMFEKLRNEEPDPKSLSVIKADLKRTYPKIIKEVS